MTFLNQALLVGLLGVSVPILIHLLNRRRFRRVPWAAMRFLRISVDRNQRRMKLEDLILLLLRCGLVALLAFAIARPVVKGWHGLPGSRVATVILVDNSASMGTREGERTRLDLAREAATAVLKQAPRNASIAVSTPFRAGEPTSEHALAARRIEELAQTDRHADLLGALEEVVAGLDEQTAAEKEVYLITDGHAEEWRNFSLLEERVRQISNGITVHLILTGEPVTGNLGVSRLAPARSLPAAGEPLRIEVDVTNYGENPAAGVEVKLSVDGQPAEESWIIDEVQPGQSESATLYARLPGAGHHRLTATLEGDAVPFDDERTVVMRAVEKVRVLLVDGEPGAEPQEAETFFLRHALAPDTEETGAPRLVEPRVIPVSEFEQADLASYQAVVLANISDLSLTIAEKLAAYVQDGGGLVIFPGGNFRPESYNTLLHAKHALLPLTFSPEGAGEPEFRTLQPASTNPLALDAALLADITVAKAFPLEITDEQSRIVLRYNDGEPALVESDFGLGKVFVFTSTADTAWNDLAIRPAFIPLVDRLLGAIIQQQGNALNIRAGDTLRHKMPPALSGQEVTVYEVRDPEALGRLTTIEEDNGEAFVQFSQTDRGGAYQATVDGQSASFLFAAAPASRESNISLLAPEQVRRLGDSARVIRWQPGSTGTEDMTTRMGSEIWFPLLLILIGLAAVEMILAQWFSRSK